MSATPIPRTMMMSLYGDMDISKITENHQNEKIITLVNLKKLMNFGSINKQLNEKPSILVLSFSKKFSF